MMDLHFGYQSGFDSMNAHDDEVESDPNTIAIIDGLKEDLKVGGIVTEAIALEAETRLANSELLGLRYSSYSPADKVRLATESLMNTFKDHILKGYELIKEVLRKIINFFKGLFGKKDPPNMDKVLGDHDAGQVEQFFTGLDNKIEEVLSTEDFRSVADNRAASIFENYRKSLNEVEVDFLTGGKRYQDIKKLVGLYTHGQFMDYITGLGGDIVDWTNSGLSKAPHIGRNEDVVSTFITNQQTLLETIHRQYADREGVIDEMDSIIKSSEPKPNHNDLMTFYTKPSTVFPKIKRLWDDSKLESLKASDKYLLSSLEKIEREYNELANQMRGKVVGQDTIWPPLEEMLKLAHTANREVIRRIHELSTIAIFIKQNVKHAYAGTNKSFSYLIRILTIVQHHHTAVDQSKLQSCLQVLQKKKRELDDFIHSI